MRNWNWINTRQSNKKELSLLITYEELKRRRAWRLRCPTFMFTNYLWGIETQAISAGVKGTAEFTNYLWGIETIYP